MNHSLQYLTWEHVGHRHNTRHFESSSYMDFQFKFLGSFQKCSKQPILTADWYDEQNTDTRFENL